MHTVVCAKKKKKKNFIIVFLNGHRAETATIMSKRKVAVGHTIQGASPYSGGYITTCK